MLKSWANIIAGGTTFQIGLFEDIDNCLTISVLANR